MVPRSMGGPWREREGSFLVEAAAETAVRSRVQNPVPWGVHGGSGEGSPLGPWEVQKGAGRLLFGRVPGG